jgi:hypothetical protein
MKTYKEYPATHSMSTAWYIVDEDGNVGIMDFDDNGPIPYEIGEHCIEELVIGVDASANEEDLRIELTDDQIYEILGKPCNMGDDWSINCIIQIYPERTDEFLSIAKTDKNFIENCISKKLGIYQIDAVDYKTTEHTDGNITVFTVVDIIPKSILNNIIGRGIIKRVYKRLNFIDLIDDSTPDSPCSGDSLPYYIYAQPYDPRDMQELRIVPKHPVKINQLPTALQNKVIRIPVKFKDTKYLQIARWVPCYDNMSKVIEAYGCGYALLPVKENEEAYCLTDILSSVPTQCDGNSTGGYGIRYKQISSFPTVLVFHGPIPNWKDRYYNDFSEITLQSLFAQYFPPKLIKENFNSLSTEEEKAIVKDSPIKEIFRNNVYVFEYIVNRFKPHLILIDDNEFEIISSVYPIENHEMNISGCKYPVYATSEVDDNRDYLTELAKLPYRGFRYPLVISIDEMKKINPDLKIPSHD